MADAFSPGLPADAVRAKRLEMVLALVEQLLQDAKGPPGPPGPPGSGGGGGGSGGGAVSSVSNSDSSLTISPTTGAVVGSLNVANANTWTALQTFAASLSSPVTGTTGNERLGNTAMNGGPCTGSYNTALGNNCLTANTSGQQNTGVGAYALHNNQGASNNTAVGVNCLTATASGGGNTAVGVAALGSVVDGNNNVGLGVQSQNDNVSGVGNCSFGYQSLYFCTGSYNLGFGYQSLVNVTSGTGNVQIGGGFGTSGAPTLVDGQFNTLLGFTTDVVVGSQNYGVALGYKAVCAANELAISPYTTFQTFYTFSSTSTLRQTHDITIVQVDNTDATRKYAFVLNAWDTAAREVLRGEASGAAAKLSFFGGTTNLKQAVTGKIASATTVADLVTTLQSLMTALATKYNLITDSTT